MHPEQSIPVHALTSAVVCPLRYYYGRHEPVLESGRYLVCKQVSLHGKDPVRYEEILQEIQYICPDSSQSLEEYLSHCLDACIHTPFPDFTDADFRVYSKKLGLSGIADKINLQDRWIAITRASVAPDRGCYHADRVRMAALTTAAEETLGIRFKGGYIEYIPSGIIRWYEPGSRDRREVLRTLQVVRSIENGSVPKKPARAPCTSCLYRERCSGTAKRVSDLF